MDPQSQSPKDTVTRRDRLLPPVRIAAIWAAATGTFIWLAFNRGAFAYTFLGSSTVLGYADRQHAVMYGAISAFLVGWVLLAPSFLFIRTRRTVRIAEMSLAIVGVAFSFWLSVART